MKDEYLLEIIKKMQEYGGYHTSIDLHTKYYDIIGINAIESLPINNDIIRFQDFVTPQETGIQLSAIKDIIKLPLVKGELYPEGYKEDDIQRYEIILVNDDVFTINFSCMADVIKALETFDINNNLI